jgi:TRAP-type C4-dicarboxylate transport system permease small subunit
VARLFLALLAFAALVIALRAARSDDVRALEAGASRKRRWPWEIIAVALVVIAVFGLFWRRWFDT